VAEDHEALSILVDQARHVRRSKVRRHDRGERVSARDRPSRLDIADAERLFSLHVVEVPADANSEATNAAEALRDAVTRRFQA
jgi:hypothetical protein